MKSVATTKANTMTVDKDNEREYYENAHIDFLRMTFPTTALFVEHVQGEWKRHNYQVRDYLSSLPRDALFCLLNNLQLVDIWHLAMTCRSLRGIVNDAKYDDYWRVRVYKTPNFLFVSNNGKYETSQGRLKVIQSIRWFDAYQWTVIRDRESSHVKEYQNMLRDRRTFNSWLHAKHGKKTLPIKAMFHIFFQDWKWKPAKDGSGKNEHVITFCNDFFEYIWKHVPITIPKRTASIAGLKETTCLKAYFECMLKHIFEFYVPPTVAKNPKNGCILTIPEDFLAEHSLVPIKECKRCKNFGPNVLHYPLASHNKWWYHHCVFYTIFTPAIAGQVKQFLYDSGMLQEFDSDLLIENIPRNIRNEQR